MSKAAALVAGAAALLAACGGGNGDTKATPTPEQVVDRLAQTSYESHEIDGTAIGKATAKVQIEMFEDFGCPHCLAFTSDIEPHLLERYVERGDVRLQYRFYPLRQVTANAAIAAWCAAEQDEFWPYHKALYTAQAQANEGTGPGLNDAFDPSALRALAADLGLDAEEFDSCTTSEAVIEVITEDLRTAADNALPGTPSFIINGEVLDRVPETREEWSELLDGMLGK